MAALSPDRARLAEAIEELRQAERYATALDAAYLPALRAAADAEAELDRANQAMAKARSGEVDRRIEELAGGGTAGSREGGTVEAPARRRARVGCRQ
jgi:hypothetical protein